MWSCIPRERLHPANLDKTPSFFVANGSTSIKQKYVRSICLGELYFLYTENFVLRVVNRCLCLLVWALQWLTTATSSASSSLPEPSADFLSSSFSLPREVSMHLHPQPHFRLGWQLLTPTEFVIEIGQVCYVRYLLATSHLGKLPQ